MAVGRVLSVMITGTGRKSWVQILSRIIWMFRIPNYIAVWKNEIETSLKARLKFPKRKWIDTSLFSNRRPETSLYKELHLICKRRHCDRQETATAGSRPEVFTNLCAPINPESRS